MIENVVVTAATHGAAVRRRLCETSVIRQWSRCYRIRVALPIV